MSAKQGFAHFQISGADFTRIARERLLEDNPGHAWRIATCLGNDDGEDRQDGVAEAALGILKGTKKLVGDTSHMKIVREHAKVTAAHVKAVNDLYAGRIRIGDKWYRPIAFITDMGPRDMRNTFGKPVYRSQNRGYLNRAWHYCGPDEIVAEHAAYPDPELPSIEREVIFRVCGERPHWLDVPLTPQAALDEFRAAGHGLEERSHSKLYGETSEEIWKDADPETVEPSETTREVRGRVALGARVKLERDAIKNGNVTPMNARINAELQLEDEIRDDPELSKLLEAEDERLKEELRLAQELDEDAREEAEAQIDRDREELRMRRLADLRHMILKQAGDDLIDLSWPAVMHENALSGDEVRIPAGAVKVPRAPFMHWAFARMLRFEDQLPPWKNVCPSGMKMMNDDANHTDWIVGAGIDPQDRALLYYPGPVTEAAMKIASELQDKFDRPTGVHVLVDGPVVSGTVYHGKRNKPSPAGSIVVLPDLRPQYLEAVDDAVGVITEAGGETAHLAQIGRERSLPIVRVVNAREKYAEGIEIMIDTGTRTVRGF